ncbi:MAG: TonB family protein [Bacteroidia bacterium]|nr:TonB family protein [Bacteroidia bacterium]
MATDIFDRDWVELVFDGRNKKYGAYEMRKSAGRNTFLGIIISLALAVSAIVGPRIVAALSDLIPEEEKFKNTEVVTMEEPPPLDEKEPPPPPVEPPPPLKSTVKFTPPVIEPDKDVPDEPPPTQDKLVEVDAGVKTEEGDKNGIDESLLQGTGKEVVEEAPPQIFTVVEQMPEFPGGEGEMMKYLGSKIKYPAMEKDNNISGRVFLTFVVEPNGNITDVKELRGVKGGPGLAQEAMRVVKSMPNWKPGKQNGKSVRVQFNLPVVFSLN